MLVVTRKRDEAIVIGDGIEMSILRVGKDGARPGVTAPPGVPVDRKETYQMVGAANLAAAGKAGATTAAPDASIVERLATKLRRDRGSESSKG